MCRKVRRADLHACWWFGNVRQGREKEQVSEMKKSILMMCLAAILILVTGIPSTAHGDIIFSNFPSGNSYDGGGFASLYTLCHAVAFDVQGGDYRLDSVSLPLWGPAIGVASYLEVTICADAAGSPGASVETLSFNASDWPVASSGYPVTTLPASGTTMLMENTTYWFVVDRTADVQTHHSWGMQTAGLIEDRAVRSFANGSWGAWSIYANSSKLTAFRVEGTIPEPATLSLLTLGGLALVRRRKRGMCK